jgi:peptidoglycan/xylan/chitin deacetylase (PgdA/CDA1 family)
MNKLSLISRNPLVLVVPIVISLLLIWQQYTVAQPQISTPKMNILPNAGLDELDAQGIPIGWQLSRADTTEVSAVKGHNSPTALLMTNNSDTRGNSATLTSPLATVQNGSSYFYKSFYKSNVAFDLLLRANKDDGSFQQTIVGKYASSDDWETVSYAFSPANGVRSVQFIYSFAGRGELELDNAYLEANPTDIFVESQPKLGENRIPNTVLTNASGDVPNGWSKYSSGNHQATLDLVSNNDGSYLHTQIADYIDGEAKWQYEPIAVETGQEYIFNTLYQSDVPAKIVAEYNLASGGKKFKTIADLLPVKDWTSYSGSLEVPADAKELAVTVVLQGNGAINAKNYGLYDTTKPGSLLWGAPRLSLTFDDGWESAFSSVRGALDNYGYSGTFYLNPSTIDTAGFMDSNQVEQLAKSKHEIGSHGYEHINFTTLDRAGIDYQFRRAHDYFEKIHAMPLVSLAVPFGGSDAQTNFYARKYYNSLRGTSNGINTRQNIDTYNLRVLYIGKDTSIESIATAIEETKGVNGWLILVYHRIQASEERQTTISPEQFQQQLEVVKKSDIKVLTVSSALHEIGGP